PFAGSVHRLLALSPVGRTYFAVLLEMLERIDHPEHLVHITAEGQVIDDHVPHDTALVDEEQTAVSHGSSPLEEEFILFARQIFAAENTVVLGNGFGRIGDNRILDAFDTPFVLRLAEPCQMGILRIDRTSHYLYAAGFEFAQLF